MSPKLIRVLLCAGGALAAVALLVSCSSSPSDDGTSTTTNGGGIGSSGFVDGGGGIGGTGFVDVATGDITGFGSIIINDVAYDTSTAQFTTNNLPATQSDLRVGMNVTAAIDSQTGAAESVIYAPIVLGPINTISLAASRFEILGQTVVVDENTALDNVSLDANASNVLAESAIVEVSGIRNADRDIVATYIRRADGATSYKLQGLIESEVNAVQQILINGLSVDVSGIDPDQFTTGVNTGDVISLSLSPETQMATAVAGSSVTLIPTIAELLVLFEGTRIRAEGYISNLVAIPFTDSFTTFNFDDLQVTTTEDTVFKFADGSSASASDLGANSRIELIATTTGVGIVTPDEIIIIER